MMCQPAARLFLSTLSARRATRVDFLFFVLYHYFYPRSPQGERPIISQTNRRTAIPFLSTLSARRATTTQQAGQRQKKISIHALRKESDRFRAVQNSQIDISIHALRKESDIISQTNRRATIPFLSTLSARRAT